MRIRPHTAAIGLACALIVAPVTALADDGKSASDELDWTPGGESNADGVQRSEIKARLAKQHPTTPVAQNPSGDQVWTGLPRLGTDDGEYCIARTWVQLDPDDVEQAEQNAWDAIAYMVSNVPELAAQQLPDECPSDPADEVPPQVFEDVVRETVVDVLPRPAPEVPPGYAMTGMAAYLVTGHDLDADADRVTYGPADHQVDLEIMQLTVTVTGEATTVVDWGDGSEPRSYTGPGRPYPEGGVSYTYADASPEPVTIEIIDRWQLSYDVYRGDQLVISDSAEFDLAPVPLDLEVRELQTVRTSPSG